MMAMQPTTPSPDTTAQLLQLISPSTAMPTSGGYLGTWPQSQPGSYIDPQYAYAYAAQYGYTQPVSCKLCNLKVCLCGGREKDGERERERERERDGVIGVVGLCGYTMCPGSLSCELLILSQYPAATHLHGGPGRPQPSS